MPRNSRMQSFGCGPWVFDKPYRVYFVGSPSAAVEGALNMAKVANENIDMATHSGEHPRFGAMDVCPFCSYTWSNNGYMHRLCK